MSDIDHDKIITGPLPRGGLVFEFMVKSRFNLDCLVFDDAEAAAASHPFFPRSLIPAGRPAFLVTDHPGLPQLVG